MKTDANKTQENKSQSVANAVSQHNRGSGSTFQFVDNRPEAIAQRKLQEMANNSPQVKQATQLQAIADKFSIQQQQPIQKKENNTGLPDNLKTGIENLSGYSMDDVKVHYNSEKPAQLNAHAYAQGTDIHLASRQEKHLPHEAWHVVQQKQGREKPTMQRKGKVKVNDDKRLEKEADVMGGKALQMRSPKQVTTGRFAEVTTLMPGQSESAKASKPVQRAVATTENEKAIIQQAIESAVALMEQKYIKLFKNDATTVADAMTYLGLNRGNAKSLVNGLMGSMNTNKAAMVAGSEVDWSDNDFAASVVGDVNGLEVNEGFLKANLSGSDSRTSTMIHESAHIFRNANTQVEFTGDIIGVSGATITPDNTEVYDAAELIDLPVALRQHNAQNVERFFTS